MRGTERVPASTMTVFLPCFLAAILTHIGAATSAEVQKTVGEDITGFNMGNVPTHFILPEHDGNCRESTTDQYNTNALREMSNTYL